MRKNIFVKLFAILCIFVVLAVVLKYQLRDQDDGVISSSNVASEKNVDMSNGISNALVDHADITIKKVDGMSSDFIRGLDLSEVIAQEKSGVRYFDQNGMEKDIFRIVSESGINCIKVRVWKDPYDKQHRSYGGGNCDLDNAVTIAKRSSRYGLKLMVMIAYSDFYTSDGLQRVPKSWEKMDFKTKEKAVAAYTTQVLEKIQKAGGLIGLIQIGNETNEQFIGEKSPKQIAKLLKTASNAADEFTKKHHSKAKIVMDFANPEDQNLSEYAELLHENDVPYDIFATTYYACWNGTLKNLTRQLKEISEGYDKEVMVAETSYPYTLLDSDGMPNSIDNKDVLVKGYAASPQGQGKMIRDVIDAVVKCGNGGVGVVYADAAWITVGNDYNTNPAIWEQFGSGWKSQYAASYDKSIEAVTEGSDVDNEALFDRRGKVLPTINAFAYAYSGSVKDK